MSLVKVVMIVSILVNIGALMYVYYNCNCRFNQAFAQDFKPEITHPASIQPKIKQ